MTVPRRKIKSDFQPVLLRRPDEIADHVSFAVAPFGITHRMGRVLTGPQTEPIVMFRGKNRPFEPRLRNDPAPLSAIKFRRIETIFRFRAVSPLAPGKCIDREMKERIHAHFLPGKLLTVRRRPEWSRCSVVHERSPFFSLFMNPISKILFFCLLKTFDTYSVILRILQTPCGKVFIFSGRSPNALHAELCISAEFFP